MEINSNIRNKPPADWISNKNAIASNNVSFVSNVLRCFHWLCWLLKNKPCLLHIELAILFVVFILLLFSSVSTVSVMTCDLQVNQSQLWYSTRQEVWMWGSKEENLSRNLPLHSWKKCPWLAIFLHYSCIQLVCVSCLCILLCNAASSQCSPRCYSGEEEENIQDGHILAGHASGWFADGGFDSVQRYEA